MREYHVGVIGYGFMGKTHTHSYKTIPLYYTNLPFTIRLEGICDTVPGVAEEAGRRILAQYPHIVQCGAQDGYIKDDAQAARQAAQARPDLMFVCLGAPKQEKWMAQYGAATGAKLLLGLGGALDVFAGVAQRAPEFYCKHNLEWFYRLIKNPSRAGRMMKLPLFLVHVAGEKRK